MSDRSEGRSARVHVALLVIGILVNAGAILLLWWDGARTPYINNEFSYTANIVTAKNTYDNHGNRFFGTQYGNASLQVELKQGELGPLVRSVLTQTDTPQAAPLIHEQPVNTKTGAYVPSTKDRPEYVFAPRNLKKSDQFYYRHPAENTSILMRFDGEEVINGLVVYRYKGEQAPVTKVSDSSVQLNPGEAVAYEHTFFMWVEPTSGWMVKHRGERKTHVVQEADRKVVRPAQYTSSTMSPQSVDQHAAYAASLRIKQLFIDQVGPSIFILLIVFLIFTLAAVMVRRTLAIPLAASIVIIVVVPTLALLGWLSGMTPMTTLFVGGPPLNPLSAICFILIGMAILARRYKLPYIMASIGGVVGVIALLQLLASLEVIGFRVDALLFEQAMRDASPAGASHISPFESFALLVLSILLVKAGFVTGRPLLWFAHFIIALTMLLGLLGLVLHFTHVNEALSIPFVQSLPVASSFLFIVCGLACLQLFHRDYERPEDIRNIFKSLLRPALAAVPILVIGAFAQMQQHAVRQDINAAFSETITGIEASIQNRLDIYTNTLTGTRGLFAASNEVRADEWRNYAAVFRGADNTPEMSAIGYAPLSGEQQAYIRYIEPNSYGTMAGRNLYEDANLQQALNAAIARGTTQLSAGIMSPGQAEAVDMFLVAPIFAPGSLVDSIAERQRAIRGFTFGVIDVPKTIRSTVNLADNVNFEIYDGTAVDQEALLYRHRPSPTESPRLTKHTALFMAGQAWTVAYYAEPGFQLSPEEELSPTAILLGGTAIYSGFLTILYLLVDLNRQRRYFPASSSVKPRGDQQ